MGGKVKEAMEVIKQAMIDEDPIAEVFRLNVATMCHNAIMSDIAPGPNWAHEVSNDAASRFMKLCFDVDTSSGPPAQEEG